MDIFCLFKIVYDLGGASASLGHNDIPVHLSCASFYRNIQSTPSERCCSSCYEGVRSNIACSARCSIASNEPTAHQPSNLQCANHPTSQSVLLHCSKPPFSLPLRLRMLSAAHLQPLEMCFDLLASYTVFGYLRARSALGV